MFSFVLFFLRFWSVLILFKSNVPSPTVLSLFYLKNSFGFRGQGRERAQREEGNEQEVNHLYEPRAEKKNKSAEPWRGDKCATFLMLRLWPCRASQRQPRRRAARNVALLKRHGSACWENGVKGRCERRQVQQRALGGGPQKRSQPGISWARGDLERCWRRDSLRERAWRLSRKDESLEKKSGLREPEESEEETESWRHSQEARRRRQTDPAAGIQRWAASASSFITSPQPPHHHYKTWIMLQSVMVPRLFFLCFRKTWNDPSVGSHRCLHPGRETNLKLKQILF